MPNLDPKLALTELEEEAVLPNPVLVRDMIFRARLDAEQLLAANRGLKDYLQAYGKSQEIARPLLKILAAAHLKNEKD